MTAADAAHLALDNLNAARKDFAPYEKDTGNKTPQIIFLWRYPEDSYSILFL